MADRDEILAFADELLELEAYPDYGPMGLQVAGAQEVDRIACGVSASLALFERSAKARAQLLLVHHGLIWDSDPRVIDNALARRLKVLLDNGITLAAYHLALDAHPEIGNNALLARKLGIEPRDRFLELGFGGPLDEPTDIEEFSARVRDALRREPLVFAHGPERIERAAVVTGSAGRYLAAAAHEGYDLFLTGEAMEPTLHTARELGIHFVGGGHYATETIGIQALAAKLAERFGVEWEFVDLPNPV
jgi:dinuclear metal center YbgI/SA1388 family protein